MQKIRPLLAILWLVLAWQLGVGQVSDTQALWPEDQPSCLALEDIQAATSAARIIAMGEATHGTRKFFQVRHGLSAYLIQEMQVRLIMVEAANLKVELLNRYIQGEAIELDSAFRALKRWVITVESMRDMVEWLRGYNMQVPDDERVRLMGFDQDNYVDSGLRLVGLLKQLPDGAALSDSVYRTLDLDSSITAYRRVKGMKRKDWQARTLWLDSLSAYLYSSSSHDFSLTQREALTEAIYHVENLKGVWQYATASRVFAGRGYSMVRDQAMARNVTLRMGQLEPGERAVLWGHNEHIQIGTMRLTGMGKYLADQWGDKYYAIGLEFGEGSFTVFDPEAQKLTEQSLPRLDGGISQWWPTGDSCISFLDLNQPELSPLYQEKVFIHDISAVKFEKRRMHQEKIRLPDHFHGMIYVPQTTPSRWMNVYRQEE